MKPRLIYVIGSIVLAVSVVATLLTTFSADAATDPASSITWTDNFSSSSLNNRWSWIRQDATHWSLTTRPGFLRITSQQGNLNAGTNKNMLVQDAPIGDFEIQTRLVFLPTENLQRAGLVIYQNDTNYFLLIRAYCGFVPPCVENGIYFDQVEQNQFIGSNFAMTTTLPGEAYLRLVRQGTMYTGYVSMNGTDWTLVGTHSVVADFVPWKVGLMVDDVNFGAAEIPADFDYFALTDNSARLFLPLIHK